MQTGGEEDGIDSDRDTFDEETSSGDSEDKDKIEINIATEDTDREDIKCDLSCSNEDDNDYDCSAKVLNDWKIATGTADPSFPKIHVLSASALMNCLNEVNSSPCNPLTKWTSTWMVLVLGIESTL